jgi:hypothetical protein
MVPRVGRGHKRENNFYMCILELESFKMKHLANFYQTWYKPFKGIQVYSNEEPSPLQRGIINKSAKIRWGYFNIFFSRHEPLYI